MIRKFTKDEFYDAIDETVWRDEEGGKHDSTYITAVCSFEGKLYEFDYEVSYNEGIQSFEYGVDTIDGIEVEAYEKTVTAYRQVK